MGPTQPTSSKSGQMLRRLSLVVNLHRTKPPICERLQGLANPLSLLPELTSKLGEILASSRLVVKHSCKARALLHRDQIMKDSDFPVYPPSSKLLEIS